MSGFLDHLFDPAGSGKKGRERGRYREKLRVLIQDAPAVRRLPPQNPPSLILANSASGQILPRSELVVKQIGEAASADHFREWKRNDSVRPIWRLDPITTEEQVLETRAMGADAYAIAVGKHDQAMTQFLVEVGQDYGLTSVLLCETPEDLAMALRILDAGVLWLRGELAAEQLLDWESFKNRIILIELTDELALDPNWVCSVVQLLDPLPATQAQESET